MAGVAACWWAAARPKTLFASAAPVILGGAFARAEGGFNLGAFALCMGFALCAQIAANFANDYFDGVRGTDAGARLGPVRAVASGAVSPAAMRAATYALLALSGLIGLGLVFYGGLWLIALGALCLCGALLYSRASYRGWGDVLVVSFFGFAAVGGTFYVQAGAPTLAVWAGAFAAGFLCDNILLVNNYRDRETDAQSGKRTLVVRWGERFARAQYAAALWVACVIFPAALAWAWGAWQPLLPVLLLPHGLALARRLRAQNHDLNTLLAHTARFLFLWSLLCAAAIVLAR